MSAAFPAFVAEWSRLQRHATPRHHRQIARWLERSWRRGDRRLLLMAFRGAGKSTLVGLFCAWMLMRRPDSRVLVLAADEALAARMVRQTRRIVERHDWTQGLRPAKPDQWGADRFTVNRRLELRDPSMLARGVAGNITGSRAELVIADDVEVARTADSAAKRALLRDRLAEIDFVLTPEGGQLFVGTPHAQDSIYARPAEARRGPAFLDGFARLEIPLLDANGRSAWPERFTPAAIERLRTRSGPAKFEAQMQLSVRALAAARLDPDLLVPYEDDLRLIEAGGEQRLMLGTTRLINAACWWDPSTGKDGADGSVVAVVFQDHEGNRYLHRLQWLNRSGEAAADLARDRAAGERQCRQVAALLAECRLPRIAVETNGVGAYLPEMLETRLRAAGVPALVERRYTTRPKDRRILEAFDAPLANGAIRAHRDVLAGPLVEEMEAWRPGAGGRDDGLDAAAGALALAPARFSRLPAPPRGPDWRLGARPVKAPEW